MEAIYIINTCYLCTEKNREIGCKHRENTGNLILTRMWPPCTGMRGTHVHLPIMTLIYGLKLNNRHGLMALWCESTAGTLTQFTTFTLMSYDLKVNFLGAKIMENLSFFNLKNFAAIIYPSLAHLGLCIIEVGCFELTCTYLVHQQKFTTLH